MNLHESAIAYSKQKMSIDALLLKMTLLKSMSITRVKYLP
jgi:hypothetical protein